MSRCWPGEEKERCSGQRELPDRKHRHRKGVARARGGTAFFQSQLSAGACSSRIQAESCKANTTKPTTSMAQGCACDPKLPLQEEVIKQSGLSQEGLGSSSESAAGLLRTVGYQTWEGQTRLLPYLHTFAPAVPSSTKHALFHSLLNASSLLSGGDPPRESVFHCPHHFGAGTNHPHPS